MPGPTMYRRTKRGNDETNLQSTVVVISNHNHDANALAFNLYTLTRKGNTVISVWQPAWNLWKLLSGISD